MLPMLRKSVINVDSCVTELSVLFNVKEELDMLNQHLSNDDIRECIQSGSNNLKRMEHLYLKWKKQDNNHFYAAFLDYFMKKSQQFKEMYLTLKHGHMDCLTDHSTQTDLEENESPVESESQKENLSSGPVKEEQMECIQSIGDTNSVLNSPSSGRSKNPLSSINLNVVADNAETSFPKQDTTASTCETPTNKEIQNTSSYSLRRKRRSTRNHLLEVHTLVDENVVSSSSNVKTDSEAMNPSRDETSENAPLQDTTLSSVTQKDELISSEIAGVEDENNNVVIMDMLQSVETAAEPCTALSYCDASINTDIEGRYFQFMVQNNASSPVSCEICQKSFRRREYLSDHMRTHTGEKPYPCPVCSKTFSQRPSLHSHMRLHTGAKPYRCQICEKDFSQNCSLRLHLRIHTGIRSFSCRICDKSFYKKGDLERHSEIHAATSKFRCEICQKDFNLKGGLNAHMRSHTEGKIFSCNVCQESFQRKDYLDNHMRMHTGERPFQCHICDKSFTQRGSLHSHLRLHTGAKPFRCDICGKEFRQNSGLYLHMHIHTGTRPFPCQMCDKTFIKKGDLERHTQTHAGVKPFDCHICQKKFKVKASRDRHVLAH